MFIKGFNAMKVQPLYDIQCSPSLVEYDIAHKYLMMLKKCTLLHYNACSLANQIVCCILIILKYRGKTFYLYMIYLQSTNIVYFSVNFLDKRSEQMGKSVLQRCNDSKPVILLMDNINMYRGRKHHGRLFA